MAVTVVEASSCSSDSTPSLGTAYAVGSDLKRQKEKCLPYKESARTKTLAMGECCEVVWFLWPGQNRGWERWGDPKTVPDGTGRQ